MTTSPTGRRLRHPETQNVPLPEDVHPTVKKLAALLEELRNPQPLVPLGSPLETFDYAGLEKRLASHISGPDSLWAPERPKPKPRLDLFSTYIKDPVVVLRDTEARPEHYEASELETIRRIMANEETTTQERSLLLMRYTRASTPKFVEKPKPKATDPDDEIILEEPEMKDVPVFEDRRVVITII